MTKTRDSVFLRRNTRLIRHAAIRRILGGRFHTNGINTHQQIVDELEAKAGFTVSKEMVSKDLREMGAVKVRDELRPNVSWWVIPAYNPNVEDLRDAMDPELIESEVAHKLNAHAMSITPIGHMVYVLTEARAGYLVSYWLSWLAWPGIILVQEHLDSCIIHCVNDEAAVNVAERLMGDRRNQGDNDE